MFLGGKLQFAPGSANPLCIWAKEKGGTYYQRYMQCDAKADFCSWKAVSCGTLEGVGEASPQPVLAAGMRVHATQRLTQPCLPGDLPQGDGAIYAGAGIKFLFFKKSWNWNLVNSAIPKCT